MKAGELNGKKEVGYGVGGEKWVSIGL